MVASAATTWNVDTVDEDDNRQQSPRIATGGTYADCDYFQHLVPDKSYDIYSPGYANATSYGSETNCRWTAVAPEEHSILLDCLDVHMPSVRI